MMPRFKPIPGETPITDVSELKNKGIKTRGQLNKAEAANIVKVIARNAAAAVLNVSWLRSRPACQMM